MASLILEEDPRNTFFLSPLSRADIIAEISARFPDRADEVRQWIESTFNLQDLARTPLFLDMILETAPELLGRAAGSITSARIYECYTRAWLKHQRGSLPDQVTPETIENALSGLAFGAYREDRSRMSFHDVTAAIYGNESIANAEEMWRPIHGATFLVLHSEEKELRFSHDSFREYFAARAVANSIRTDELANADGGLYGTDYWTVPLDRFLLGLLGEDLIVDKLNHALSAHPNIGVRMNCATTIGRWSDLRSVEMLSAALESEADVGVAGRAAEALQRMGKPDKFWEFLRRLPSYKGSAADTGKLLGQKLLYDVNHDWSLAVPGDVAQLLSESIRSGTPRIRKYATYMAGRLECRECVDEVVALAGTLEDARTNMYAAAALGRIGNESTLEFLEGWSDPRLPVKRRIEAATARLQARLLREGGHRHPGSGLEAISEMP